jgi:hypothetical protein
MYKLPAMRKKLHDLERQVEELTRMIQRPQQDAA